LLGNLAHALLDLLCRENCFFDLQFVAVIQSDRLHPEMSVERSLVPQ
jgi:hypothetical protein